jgi:hypothetical protein
MPEAPEKNKGLAPEPPAVHIRHSLDAPREVLTEISLGLEEEGIPVEFIPTRGMSYLSESKEAAMASRLNVGLGLDWASKRIALHHRDLPLQTPLFDLSGEAEVVRSLRRLGANAARLVKGDPLLLDEPVDEASAKNFNQRAPKSNIPL